MANEAETSFYLPEDLISNIFILLPIKSLLVCTCVCKTWNSFIKSPAFISSHLKHTISSLEEENNAADLCLHQLCSLPVEIGRTDYRFGDRELTEYRRVYFPVEPELVDFQVLASCNGLVYFTHARFYFNSASYHWILWNPATRKTKIITEHQNLKAIEATGLGFDSKSGDYKILRIVEERLRDENLVVDLYSLKSNSWKQLPDLDAVSIKDTCMYREMACVNGVLHFVVLQSRFREPRFLILGFDLADEIFHEIMLPDCMANHFGEHFISACGESLSVLWLKDCIASMEIWVMKEYGVEGSWTKVSTVSLDSFVDRLLWTISEFVFKRDSHVLLSLSYSDCKFVVDRIFSHDLKSQETKEFAIDRESCYYLGNYVESLVLLDEANDQPPEIESDDANDESGSGSSSNADYVYDHGDLGAEEDLAVSHSSLYASDE